MTSPTTFSTADLRPWKGNLHSHSTLSDGSVEPAESIGRYRRRGYDFCALSDHERFFDSMKFDSDKFLVLPAIESAVEEPKDGYKGHHLNGILGTPAQRAAATAPFAHGQYVPKLEWRSPATVQHAIDRLNAAGLMAMYNHPVWSRLEVADILNVRGIFAIEIFNYGSEIGDATGLSTDVWDLALRRGRRVFGLATDDSHHGGSMDSPYYDAFGGWVVVVADRLSRDAITTALHSGTFYSSSGPEIHRFACDGHTVEVECSPVREVRFVSYERRGSVTLAAQGQTVTGGKHTLKGNEVFVRVECVDDAGRTAWTNPVFLDDAR